MAAGLGTRLRPFTQLVAKPMLPLMGVPMAQFAVDLALQAGVTRMVANLHYRADETRAGLKGLDFRSFSHGQDVSIDFSDESNELLGSAGGIRKAFPLLGEGAALLLNTDVLCDIPVGALIVRHHELRRRFGVRMTLGLLHRGPKGGKYREIQVNPVTGIVSGAGELVEGRPFFSGVAIIEKEALVHVPPSGPSEFLPTILTPGIREGWVGSYVFKGDWFDIGSPLLWQQTHLELIERLETGRLRPSWRKRIEAVARRTSNGVWTSGLGPVRFDADSPAYVDLQAAASMGVRVNGRVPSRSVVYGALDSDSHDNKVETKALLSYQGTTLWI